VYYGAVFEAKRKCRMNRSEITTALVGKTLLTLVMCIPCVAVDQPLSKNWRDVPMPFRPVNITAAGGTIWVCGADEMIVASTDGGVTWETKHQNRDGEVLLNIAFVDEKIGHAAGTGGLLLSTVDAGQTWKGYSVGGTVRRFSFADAANGIAVVSSRVRQPTDGTLDQVQGAAAIDGIVRVTHDGGDHWQDVIRDDEKLRRFSEVLSVVALDPSRYLVAMREPEIENTYAVTQDAGKTWKPVHLDDVFAQSVFRHASEYWAFGIEYLDRKNHGGYSAPVVLHSKDGETWAHGIRGPNEFTSCNVQGCYLWDGTIEDLYGAKEVFWALAQDDSLTEKWAIAAASVCTVDGILKCALATATDKPQPRPEPPGGIIISAVLRGSGPFAEGCLECDAGPIIPDDPGLKGRGRVVASLTIRRNGSVGSVSVAHAPNKRMTDDIAKELAKWLFEPAHEGPATIESYKVVPIDLLCIGWPGPSGSARCSLLPAGKLSGASAPTSAPATVKQ